MLTPQPFHWTQHCLIPGLEFAIFQKDFLYLNQIAYALACMSEDFPLPTDPTIATRSPCFTSMFMLRSVGLELALHEKSPSLTLSRTLRPFCTESDCNSVAVRNFSIRPRETDARRIQLIITGSIDIGNCMIEKSTRQTKIFSLIKVFYEFKVLLNTFKFLHFQLEL